MVEMLKAAKYWYKFGFQVIPLIPETKKTACKWDPWLDTLNEEKIREYWTKHPDHEIGFIVGDDLIVFDADTPESVTTLYRIEDSFEVKPTMIVKTEKGEHHFFQKGKGILAKTCGHGDDPEQKIDIKTGRTMVVLPPSGGKKRIVKDAKNTTDLPEVEQWFVNTAYLMMGKAIPGKTKPIVSEDDEFEVSSVSIGILGALVGHLDPDCPYQDWFSIIAAIYNSSGGSEAGFELANRWSSKGQKYKNSNEIRSMWNALSLDVENPITIATIVKKVQELGIDTSNYFLGFEIAEFVVEGEDQSDDDADQTDSATENVEKKTFVGYFEKFSLTGTSEELEKNAVEPVFVLDNMALLGQTTIICGEANSGKTLVSLKLLTESIEAGRIDPKKLFYLNMDDNFSGVVEKVKIAEKCGSFEMLAEGHNAFKTADFIEGINDYIYQDQAKGMILILDTYKKFVDVMNKSKCREFNSILRKFSAVGGTIIALAHTNKKKGADGNPIFGGVSDLKDDFDCMYILKGISEKSSKVKIVEFNNEKSRGPVVDKVAYSFEKSDGGSYKDLVLSVQKIDEDAVTTLKFEEELHSDEEVIDAVISCIKGGMNTKMQLATATAEVVGISQKKAQQVIEKYSGNDPAKHRWNYTVKEHGRKVFTVLESTDIDGG